MEYMSQEGYDKIVEELRQLERVELPRVKDAIAEARDKGDLSENFEYHAAKREQGRLLSRIRFKQRVLEFARVIDKSKLGGDGVGLLSKVELTNMGNNTKMTYTVVSPHEANLPEGKISIKSPIAQALLKKQVGDTVEVKVPVGTIKLRIDSIKPPSFEEIKIKREKIKIKSKIKVTLTPNPISPPLRERSGVGLLTTIHYEQNSNISTLCLFCFHQLFGPGGQEPERSL
jgi:transcription elongation factor GreA